MSDRFNNAARTASACLACAVAAFPSLALAQEHRGARSVPLLPAYQQECSSCHVAYQPWMLPAGSWQRIVNNLERHFGTDASLDDATVKQLEQWLTAQAGPAFSAPQDARALSMKVPPADDDRSSAWFAIKEYETETGHPPEDRITRSAWFWRVHRKISAAAWRQLGTRSMSSCEACHTTADQGDFDERNVRIPE